MPDKRPRQGKTFLSILFSLVLMLVLPISATIYMTREVHTRYIEQTIASNMSTLERTKADFGALLTDVSTLVNHILLHPETGPVTRLTPPLTTQDRYFLYTLTQEYHLYHIARSAVSDFFVYFPNIDLAISPKAYFSSQSAYRYRYAIDGLSYDRFATEILSRYIPAQFLAEDIRDLASSGGIRRAYIYSVRDPGKQECLYNIFVMFDVDKLAGTLFASDNGESRVMVLDGQGRYLFGTSRQDAAIVDDCLAAVRGEAKQSIVIDEEEYFINHTSNTILGVPLQYIALMPVSRPLAGITRLMVYYGLGIGVCLLVGLLIAYILARKNYAPIGQLLAYIGANTEQRPHAGRRRSFNEPAYIRTVIEGLIERGEQLSAQQLEYVALVRSYYLLQLLHGYVGEEMDFRLHMRRIGIAFPYRRFIVALFAEESTDAGARQPFTLSDPENHFALKDRLQREIGKLHVCHIIEYRNGILAMIVNLSDELPGAQAKDDLTGSILAVRKAFGNEDISFMLNAYFGSVVERIDKICESCWQAEEIIGLHRPEQPDRIAFYADIRDQVSRIHYSVDIEQRLVSQMASGNTESALSVVDDVWHGNLGANSSLFEAQCIAVLIIGTIIKQISGSDNNQLEAYGLRQAPWSMLKGCASVQGVYDLVAGIVQNVCVYTSAQSSDDTNHRERRLTQYIDEHFHKSTLTQAQIAAEFNISPSYLSFIFKKDVGENMHKYIEAKRLQAAKEYLVQSDLSVEEIANRVGFIGALSLIRLFKKYENTTPGKYRQLHQRKK